MNAYNALGLETKMLIKERDELREQLRRAKDFAWKSKECGCSNTNCIKEFDERWKRQIVEGKP